MLIVGSSPARTSRYSHLSDPGPYRSPLRIPPVIVASDATSITESKLDSGSESDSESAYDTATSPAPIQPATSVIELASSLHSPTLSSIAAHDFSMSSASTSSQVQPSLHVAFETPV